MSRTNMLAAFLLVIAGPAGAWAGSTWSLTWLPNSSSSALISNTGRDTLLLSHTNVSSSANNTPVDIAQLGVHATGTDQITHQNYLMVFRLTDLASKASKVMFFSGWISGTISTGAEHLTNTFVQSTLTATLGKEVYTIHVGPFNQPGSNGKPLGSFAVSVSYHAISTGAHATAAEVPLGAPPVFATADSIRAAAVSAPAGNVNSTPEPASWVLAAVGAFGAGFGWWRRKIQSA